MASLGKQTVEAAFERLKIILGIHSEGEIGEFLGLTKQTMSNWKFRGTLDIALIKEKIDGISIDWLIDGIGEPLLKDQRTNQLKEEVSKLNDILYKPIQKGIKGSSIAAEEVVQYRVEQGERLRVPIIYSKVSSNVPDNYDIIRGYYYSDYIVNENVIMMKVKEERYVKHGIEENELLAIDTKRKPKNGDYIVLDTKMSYIIATFEEDEKGHNYMDLGEGKEKVYIADENSYIEGVIIAKIKNYN